MNYYLLGGITIKKGAFYSLTLLIIILGFMLVIHTIRKNQEYFSELPPFEEIESNDNYVMNNILYEIEIKKETLAIGFQSEGQLYLKEDDPLQYYTVQETELTIGEFVNVGQPMDKANTIFSKGYGQVIAIEQIDTNYQVTVLDYSAFYVVTALDPHYLNYVTEGVTIFLLIGGRKIPLSLMRIGHELNQNTVELELVIEDIEKITMPLINSQTVMVEFIISEVKDAFVIPKTYNLYLPSKQYIRRGEKIFEIYLHQGREGLYYNEVKANVELQEGDKILVIGD